MLLAGGISIFACTDANDVAGCRELEDARCERAVSCGIDLEYPLHTGDTAADAVTSCKLFYEDACLHGLVTSINLSAAPNTGDLAACYSAIVSGDCDYVVNPQLAPGCAWLNPPDAGIDAGVDAAVETSVATSTATVVVSADGGVDAAYADCVGTCDMMCDDDETCIDQCPEGCGGP